MYRKICSCIVRIRFIQSLLLFSFFFFNDTATTEIYTLSLHDALPIYSEHAVTAFRHRGSRRLWWILRRRDTSLSSSKRSEEHTSELQSRLHLVCRLLLEKKKNSTDPVTHYQRYLTST